MKLLIKGFLVMAVLVMLSFNLVSANQDITYVIEIRDSIDGGGLTKYIQRALNEASINNAKGILLLIDTPGGFVDASKDISQIIINTNIPVLAYVEREALSAGVLITISADHIAMAPGSSIGAAEPSPAEEKIISAWTSTLRTTADRMGRDGEIAAAMSDANIEIEGLVEKGKILTLTANKAVELGFADIIAVTPEEALAHFGMPTNLVSVTPSFSERIARFVTNPVVAPILLSLGFVGLVTEIFTQGWGVAGTLGLISFALYFGGHMIAGLAGWESIILFIAGIILLTVEVFIPGFGLPGISGSVAILASIFLASASVEVALRTILIALFGSIILLILIFKYFTKSSLLSKIILFDKEDKELGYVGTRDYGNFIGKRGTTLTPLRPAGSALIEGNRVDVVTEGNFIPVNTTIEVVKVEGTRIVVKITEN